MQWTKQEFEESKCRMLPRDHVSSVADRQLGRRVKSGKRARKSYRSRGKSDGRFIAIDVFVPPKGTASLSVDCLGVVDGQEVAGIAVKQMKKGEKFYGWYVLTVRDIYDNHCQIKFSPTLENKYHADILFPVDIDQNGREDEDYHADEIRTIADCLASCAVFEPYGEWTDEVSLVQT